MLCGRRHEHGVLPQDRRLELTQGGAGFEAQLVHQPRACVVVRLQGVRLASRAVERKHQRAAQPLSERMVPDDLFQLGHQLGGMA